MTSCGHIDLTRLAATLAPARRLDMAAGMLLAAELLPELAVPAKVGHAMWTALHDAAVAIHPAATSTLASLLHPPDIGYNGSSRPCGLCNGVPGDTILAVGRNMRRIRAQHRHGIDVARSETTSTLGCDRTAAT